MIKLLLTIDSILVKILKAIVGSLMFLIMCTLFAAVIFRYFLNRPIFWADEAATYGQVCLTFFGAYLVLRAGKMVRVTFIVDLFPKFVTKILSIAANIITIGLMFVFAHQGLFLTQQRIIRIQTTVALQIPVVIFYSMIPLMAILLIYGLILDILTILIPDKFHLDESVKVERDVL